MSRLDPEEAIERLTRERDEARAERAGMTREQIEQVIASWRLRADEHDRLSIRLNEKGDNDFAKVHRHCGRVRRAAASELEAAMEEAGSSPRVPELESGKAIGSALDSSNVQKTQALEVETLTAALRERDAKICCCEKHDGHWSRCHGVEPPT